jgi:hypothetical protein
VKTFLVWLCLAAPLAAQDTQVRGPLRPLADNPTAVLPALPFPDLLLEAAPVVGLFRSAWLPAGLARDVTAPGGVARLGMADASGAYRRPFDPDDVRAIGIRAAGWRRVGIGAAWGRVVAEDVRLGSMGHASHTQPYGSSPIVLADTTDPAAKRVRYTLEGAMGLAAGSWLIGLSGGLVVSDLGTRETQFVRTNRHSTPAVELNVGRDLFAGLTLLLYGRWMGGSETMFLRPEPSQSRAFRFSGFDDPLPLDIVPPGAYFRRTQRDAYDGGAALAGRLFGAPWVLSVGRTYRKDIHFDEVRQDPPADDWVADGWTVVAAHQRRLPFGITGTLQLDGNRLVGDVTLAAVEGVVTRVKEHVLAGSLDLRWTGPDGALQAALRLGLDLSRRQLDDYLVLIGADVRAVAPSAVMEVAYRWAGTAVSLAGGIAGRGEYPTLPRPAAMGPVYQEFIAPSWSRDATRARTLLGAVTVRQRLSARAALFARADLARLAPTGAPVPPLPAESGNYSAWRVALGVVGL